MNKFVKAMCFIGGANIEILQKCPTEKNGFIATGVGIINVVILSIITMGIKTSGTWNGNILFLLTSLFYGFIIFIAYWGILSIIRKTIKYSGLIKFFAFISVLVFSFIATVSVLRFVGYFPVSTYKMTADAIVDTSEDAELGLDTESVGVSSFGSAILNNRNIPFHRYLYFIIVFMLVLFVYLIPIVLKWLINSSTYEEEKGRIEHNFLVQKEADIIAYKQKYGDYALYFNEANIKMESIKHLGALSKEYHELLDKILKDTFDQLNKVEKIYVSEKGLLEDCRNNIETQFKLTIEKMSKIFSGI